MTDRLVITQKLGGLVPIVAGESLRNACWIKPVTNLNNFMVSRQREK